MSRFMMTWPLGERQPASPGCSFIINCFDVQSLTNYYYFRANPPGLE